MKHIILTTLFLTTLTSQAFAAPAAKEIHLAKKPTDAQILQFKILKAFKQKRTLYKA